MRNNKSSNITHVLFKQKAFRHHIQEIVGEMLLKQQPKKKTDYKNNLAFCQEISDFTLLILAEKKRNPLPCSKKLSTKWNQIKSLFWKIDNKSTPTIKHWEAINKILS